VSPIFKEDRFMKNSYVWFFVLLLGLTSCSNSQVGNQTFPTVVMEVTRIVQITTTPIPEKTSTPTPTLKPVDAMSTKTSELIGTPIAANWECYETAVTQGDLNNCSNIRRDEMEKQMTGLVNAIKERRPNAGEEFKTFLKFQSEWENFTQRECLFRSGYGKSYSGSMALMNYNECLVQKYEDRLRELQGILYEMSY
jgi:uncharacterized protein YecT (DUF1311 family)